MARPDTPGKRFNEFASQSFWGVESARKTIATVLYTGCYIDITGNFQDSIKKYFESGGNESELKEFQINGKIKTGKVEYFVLHDRTKTANIVNKINSIKSDYAKTKDSKGWNAGALEFLSAELGEDIIKKVYNIYTQVSPDSISEYALAQVFKGIYAFQNSYRLNTDVIFGLNVKHDVENPQMRDSTFIVNVPIARSKVGGRHDHVELVKIKNLGDSPSSTDLALSGQDPVIINGVQSLQSANGPSSELKIVMDALKKSLDKTNTVVFKKNR